MPYFKEQWCHAAGKDPLRGLVDGFFRGSLEQQHGNDPSDRRGDADHRQGAAAAAAVAVRPVPAAAIVGSRRSGGRHMMPAAKAAGSGTAESTGSAGSMSRSAGSASTAAATRSSSRSWHNTFLLLEILSALYRGKNRLSMVIGGCLQIIYPSPCP